MLNPTPEAYSFERYLQAKQSVDARAFNLRTWQAFVNALAGRSGQSTPIVEFGAGTGSMAERLLSSLPNQSIDYTLIDQDSTLLKSAEKTLKELPAVLNGSASINMVTSDAAQWLRDSATTVSVDVYVAHAFMDLVVIDGFLDQMLPLLNTGGLLYFPINFDGLTLFEPQIDAEFEQHILSLYHQSMQNSHSGRDLLHSMMARGIQILETGSSDWIVYPRQNAYPADEAYFLLHILKFFENELSGKATLDQARFRSWLDQRRQQIAAGELVYIAHQLDILAQKP